MLHVSVLIIPLLWNGLGWVFFFFLNVWLSTFAGGIIQDWNLIYGRLLRPKAVEDSVQLPGS